MNGVMMKPNKYEFTIEELNCYTITLEIEPQDCPDAEQDAAWDKFHALDYPWMDHPTCIEHDGNVDVEIYGPFSEGEQTETEWRVGHD